MNLPANPQCPGSEVLLSHQRWPAANQGTCFAVVLMASTIIRCISSGPRSALRKRHPQEMKSQIRFVGDSSDNLNNVRYVFSYLDSQRQSLKQQFCRRKMLAIEE